MPKKEQRPTADELLIQACRPGSYGNCNGTSFDREDVLTVADMIRGGLITLEEDAEYGHRLMPTDKGWLRYHEMKCAEYAKKLGEKIGGEAK